MKKICIFFTGGTISMKKDKSTNAAIPVMSGQDILKLTPGIESIAQIDFLNFCMLPGPHMTPKIMFDLSNEITKKLEIERYDGIVVTHGTDSLEETAYFVHLTAQTDKPIVFVGAMKNSSELGWDGPSNLLAAVNVAISDESYNKGTLVVMNNEIHSASQVTKTNTSSLDTFKSLDFGPIGIFDNEKVFYFCKSILCSRYKIDYIDDSVDLIKCACGMDSKLINYCIDTNTHGIVIEGMGRGNIPPKMVNGIKYAISKNIPVVLVSRCNKGNAIDTYGYEGAGKDLTNIGVILGGNLPGQKARILLMIALSMSKDINKIKTIFDELYN